MSNWTRTRDRLPPLSTIVETKIDDAGGARNVQRLFFAQGLWWEPNGTTYVYYNPTHWRAV